MEWFVIYIINFCIEKYYSFFFDNFTNYYYYDFIQITNVFLSFPLALYSNISNHKS